MHGEMLPNRKRDVAHGGARKARRKFADSRQKETKPYDYDLVLRSMGPARQWVVKNRLRDCPAPGPMRSQQGTLKERTPLALPSRGNSRLVSLEIEC